MADVLRGWAAALDRSFAEIAEIAADARRFDRPRLNRIADTWDNSIHRFVRAACTLRPRAQQAIARDGTAYRDWRSHQTEPQPLTPDVAAQLDLSRAEVSELTIERSQGRLECRMSIVGHATESSYALPDMHIRCSEVETMRFDAMDRRGIAIGGPGLSLGAGGYVEASDVRFWGRVRTGDCPPEPDGEPTATAELMIAAFEGRPEPSTATLVYATPGEPWVLRRIAVQEPSRFTVDSAAFECPRGDSDGLVRLES